MNIDRPSKSRSPNGQEHEGSSLSFGDNRLENETIRSFRIEERLEGNQVVKSGSIDVYLPKDVTWDYHSTAHFQGPKNLQHKGVCVKATRQEEGTMRFTFEGTLTEFTRSTVKNIEFLGMSPLETAYWFPLLTGLVRGVEVPGLRLDNELRPFLYAVPLKGLTVTGSKKVLMFRDSGIVSGDHDDLLQPLLNNSKIGKTESVWCSDVPKAWGVVIAEDLIEAEQLALDRAQFTADLVSFALRSGISHFQTRFESLPLEWNIETGRTSVMLEPWIVFLDQKHNKGWIRTVPLVDLESTVDLESGYERIMFFAERILGASKAGDLADQAQKRVLSDRERKLSNGVQRALRWLSIAWNEGSMDDQFIATWISLESILNSADLPKVFEGGRKPVRTDLRKAISDISFPQNVNPNLDITLEMIQGRLFQNQWSLRTKLSLFADVFGTKLKSGDTNLIVSLSKIRNKLFHDGRREGLVTRDELRQLQYLVERLIATASVGGYADLEEQCRYKLQFGEIGPEGGAAPLTLNGRDVPYTFWLMDDERGNQIEEFVIEGKIYSPHNSDLSFTTTSGVNSC